MRYFKVIERGESTFRLISEVDSNSKESKVALSENKASFVLKDLADNKIVTFNTETEEISVTKEKEKTKFNSDKKKYAELKLKEKYLKFNDTESMIDMIFYIDATMTLFDSGYIITDENREEKYIEIIESCDEKLIELLEEYLIIKDDVSKIKWNKKQYLKCIKKLKDLDEDSEELEQFIKEI